MLFKLFSFSNLATLHACTQWRVAMPRRPLLASTIATRHPDLFRHMQSSVTAAADSRQSTHNPHPWTPRCWDATADAALPFGKRSPFCPAWPDYNATGITDRQKTQFQRMIDRLVATHEGGAGVPMGRLAAIMQRPCVRRFCVRVQILSGVLYVVAPFSRDCTDGPRVVNCSKARRMRSEGLAMTGAGDVGKWSSVFSPTELEWDFVAGLNVSDCSPSIRPGDVNGAFTRVRLLAQLRLLEEAARHGGVDDTELVLCAGEAPLNAGSWCLPSAPQPVFATTGNEDNPLLPFPHWLPRLRDVDFSLWDDARAAMRAASARSASKADPPAPSAVFRGGIYRLSAYSDDWRASGLRRTRLDRDNWRRIGRLALLQARSEPGSVAGLINVNVAVPQDYARWLGIDNGTLRAMDHPAGLSMLEQARQFRYVINAEGHGGWADRLARLLLSPQLVIAQDLAARLWFEGLLTPGVTHLTTDSNFRNLSRVVRWARRHEAEVAAMVDRANEVVEAAVSVGGIRFYVREILRQYTRRLLRYAPRRDLRAIQFSCLPRGQPARCRASGSVRLINEVGCAFVAADGSGRRLSTLHEASQTIAGALPETTAARAARAARGSLGAAGSSPWCYELSDRTKCQGHSVRKKGRWRACVWHKAEARCTIESEGGAGGVP